MEYVRVRSAYCDKSSYISAVNWAASESERPTQTEDRVREVVNKTTNSAAKTKINEVNNESLEVLMIVYY